MSTFGLNTGSATRDASGVPAVVETWDSNGAGVSDDSGEGWDGGAGCGSGFTDAGTGLPGDCSCDPGTGSQTVAIPDNHAAVPSNEVGEVGQASRDLGMPYDRPWLT